jgi:pyruvate dehydrogenase E1 component alpha subunit
MMRIRLFEESVQRLYKQAALPGFVHLYIGEEATAVGVCGALEAGDTVFSTHRPHGHCLACGSDPAAVFAELYGFETGLCRGKSGSMHLVDVENGFLGANGIVGAGIALALGPALQAVITGSKAVSVVFFGDGASNSGAFHESLNLASLWNLPVVFVCENDGYAEATPREYHQRIASIAHRATSYGMPGVTVDGQDVRAVRAAALEAIALARAAQGPTLLECLTVRYGGHFEGDGLGYHRPDHLDEARKRDPLLLLRRYLIDVLGLTEDDIAADTRLAEAEIAMALEQAQQGHAPALDAALADLYATPIGAK